MMTAREAATMEALCSLRRGDHERIHGWRNPGILEGAGSSWDPYIDHFQQEWGWRPSQTTWFGFDRRVQREPFFYAHNPNYR